MNTAGILLIGADGTLGTALSEVFRNERLIRWTQREVDLTSSDLRRRVTAVSPSIVINAAAYTDVDGAETNESLADAINATAVGEIAKACHDLGSTVVHYSTDYVFDGSSSRGYAEDAIPHPINAYGRTKLHGERLLVDAAPRYFIVRTSRLFGRHGMKSGAKQNFIDKMIALSDTKSELSVVDDETTSPTYAADLARSTLDLLEHYEPGVYHRTNDGSCTWHAFALEIFRILGRSITLKPVSGSSFPRPAKRPAQSTLVSTKVAPLRRWQPALSDYIASLTIAHV